VLVAGYFLIWIPAQHRAKLAVGIERVEELISMDRLDQANAIIDDFLIRSWVSPDDRAILRALRGISDSRRQAWRGRIQIKEPQPIWALVELNGVAVRPETVELPIGRHEIRVSSPGYDSVLLSVDLMTNGELKTVDGIVLDRFNGGAKLQSRPTGVEFELKMSESDANRPEEFGGIISVAPAAFSNPEFKTQMQRTSG